MKGLLIQEFKTLFKSPAAISILIIPIVLMVGLGYLLPSGWIVPSAITIGIVGSVLLYFGGSLEEIKRTSFMKSISLTKLNKFTFLANKILFSILISLFSVLWVLFFAWLFTEPIPFLAINFSHLIPPTDGVEDLPGAINDVANGGDVMNIVLFIQFKINWEKIDWIAMLYAGMITIIVSISLAFVFVSFSKSSLSFYLMSFGYLLSMILFGGVVMPSFLIDKDSNGWFTYLYYLIPNYYTNNVMATSFNNGIGDAVNGISDLVSQVAGSDAVTNASDVVVNDLSSFLNTWDGSDVSSLTSWYEAAKITFADSPNDLAFVEYSYSLLQSDYSSFIAGILNIIADPLTDKIGALDKAGSWNLIHSIVGDKGIAFPDSFPFNMIGLGGHTLFTTTFDQAKFGEKSIWITAWAILKPMFAGDTITNLITNNSEAIGDMANPYILKYVIGTLLTDVKLNVTINSLLSTLTGMFNTAHWWDYIVPWGETAIFLLISTKFFNWS